jgi:hypothetical protein
VLAVVNSWIQLNRDARKVCKEACDRIARIEPRDSFVNLCAAFMSKGTDTLSAVNVLYAHRLEEPAQALIRILFELRINFDCFLQLAQEDPREAVQRVLDSMMLEKVKQARAARFAGIPELVQRRLEQDEKDIAERYSPDVLSKIRKHGFTGLPIEQRASRTGHQVAYSIVYRNFSRNVHATDYVESYLRNETYDADQDRSYRQSRDIAAHYTAHFSAVGMMEFVNHVFSLGLEREINELGQRQREIKDMAGQDDA